MALDNGLPARLYHGTTERHLDAIMQHGLQPRGKKKGNWKETIESNPNAVYLTDAYPFHFAENASKGERLLILEIDTSWLLPWAIAPDEDFLEQVTRKVPEYAHLQKLTMHKRTRWFRARALSKFQQSYKVSLKHMGTCCYHGSIEPRFITRYALVDRKAPIRFMSDPTITLMNYAVMKGFYRNLISTLFGDNIEVNDQDIMANYTDKLLATSREGIEVATCHDLDDMEDATSVDPGRECFGSDHGL